MYRIRYYTIDKNDNKVWRVVYVVRFQNVLNQLRAWRIDAMGKGVKVLDYAISIDNPGKTWIHIWHYAHKAEPYVHTVFDGFSRNGDYVLCDIARV